MEKLSRPDWEEKRKVTVVTVRGLHPESAELLRRVFLGETMHWPVNETAQEMFSEEIFFQDVVSQGMAPLLFRKLAGELAGEPGTTWPQSLVQRLRELAFQQSAVEMVAELDLRQLLATFADRGITPLLLKGTPLSYTLYPEPGLRPRCDTDLLILAQDREKTTSLMQESGYAPLHEAQVDYINTQMSYARNSAQGVRCCYDIHWQVSNCNRQFSQEFANGKIFEKAQDIPVLGENARTLNKVDALIFACFHRAGHFSHSGDRLIWLYDIHLLCQALTEQEGLIFSQRIKELQIISLCVDALKTTQSWFSTVCPESLQDILYEKNTSANTQEDFAYLLGSSRSDGIKQQALLELQGLPTWKKRVLYLL
ncbi:MAG: hypothetical protein D3916_06745, partial [Candidatus Electrothrix sp. MAN1_4]|nr:hypothetical protein [Candidatus Electrothrix sp. MAN1_4]